MMMIPEASRLLLHVGNAAMKALGVLALAVAISGFPLEDLSPLGGMASGFNFHHNRAGLTESVNKDSVTLSGHFTGAVSLPRPRPEHAQV